MPNFYTHRLLGTAICLALTQMAHASSALPSDTTDAPNPTQIHLTKEDLLADVVLFERILWQALQRDNADELHSLTKLYAQADNHDPDLLNYTYAKLATARQQHQTAITHYQRILDNQPDAYAVRLKLMQAFAYDGQFANAKKELAKLKDHADIDPKTLTQDQAWLDQQSAWRYDVGFGLLHDKNINNAPRQLQYEHWQLQPAMTAYGVHISPTAQNLHNFYNHWSWYNHLNLDAKPYNKHRFDDINLTASTGLRHRTSTHSFGITPYVQYRWYGTQPYSYGLGVRLHSQTQLKQSHLNLAFYATDTKHKERTFLDGVATGISAGIQHPTSHGNVWLNITHHRQNAKDKSESHHDNKLNFGTQQTWSDFGTSHNVSLSYRHYHAKDIFNIHRTDKRYSTHHSFWHNKVHYKGYTPSLNIAFERVDSNHFAFDAKDAKAYIQIHKQF